jgi:hypothetical protein
MAAKPVFHGEWSRSVELAGAGLQPVVEIIGVDGPDARRALVERRAGLVSPAFQNQEGRHPRRVGSWLSPNCSQFGCGL